MTKLKKLVDISNFYGSRADYVIAGGGNTSFKNKDYLWIKASGTSLATITEEGFVKMNRECLDKISHKEYSKEALKREAEIKKELYGCIAEETSKRPSVETSLHNLLDFAYVVHTHPTLVNALMCAKNSHPETEKIFGDRVLYIKYTDPGYVLFKLVEKRIKEYRQKWNKEPKIIFLENHGVFVSANEVDEIKNLYKDIENKIGARLNLKMPSDKKTDNELSAYTDKLIEKTGLKVKALSSDLIHEFVKDEAAFEKAATAFTPDNIVYCKAHYPFSESDPAGLLNEYDDFEKVYGYAPKVMGIKGKGIICLADNEKSVNTVCDVFLDMLKISYLSGNFGGPRIMTKEQIEFIDNWEVENYRRNIASKE